MKRSFKNLSPIEVLALAISLEEEDSRILQEFARLTRARLILRRRPSSTRCARRGRRPPAPIGRCLSPPLWRRDSAHTPRGHQRFRPPRPNLFHPALGYPQIRSYVALMELETGRFYSIAAATTSDAELRQLLGDLAEEERHHEARSAGLAPEGQPHDEHVAEARVARQLFVMQVIQPGLVGLMDGSVSTLAPLFAAAFATRETWPTFLVGLAAAVGAAISMGFAEALSDDGSLTGRGRPYLRGVVCGLMTFAGAIGHALPYLIPHFWIATSAAMAVVGLELILIAWIRNHYMDSPFLPTIIQVLGGGILVFLAGILIGSA